jgi:SecD/SecF fusion protein
LASRRSHLTLIALLIAALVGVALLAVPSSPFHKKLTQGLDLVGGLEVVLQAQPPPHTQLQPSDLSRSESIIRQRIDKLGVSEPVVRKQGSNQILIQLPAISDIAQAESVIGKTAQLELYDLTPSLLPPSIDAAENPIPINSLFSLLARVQSGTKGKPTGYWLFRSNTKTIAGPKANPTTEAPTLAALKAQPQVRALKPVQPKRVVVHVPASKGKPAHTKVVIKGPGKTSPGFPTGYQWLAVPNRATVITCSQPTAQFCPGLAVPVPAGTTYYYLFKHGVYPLDSSSPFPQMTGKDLKLSGTQQDFDSNGQPDVTIQFTGSGRKLFHAISRNEAQTGSRLGNDNYQSFAIVLDGQLYSYPSINYHNYPDGIDPVNGAQITGLGSLGEAKNLALVLQTGALPVKFKIVEHTQVSATLGKDSLRQARNAAIGGLLVVALFLLLFYRFLGLVAVLGLGIYVAFMYAAILIFGVTLTLPGFAGLILTIGVAADANVVVFERIKEEARAGKSVRAAIATGYAKGFRTIVDANVVTCITAVVLFGFATAEVQGFALMLLIGTVVSLVTAVAATRAMLGLLAGFRWFENPAFMGASGAQKGRFLQLDFMGKRRTWFAISGAVIAIGLISLGVKGLNFGIDFKGGVQIGFQTPKPVSIAAVRALTSPDAVVQGRGSSSGGDSYKSFQIQLKKLATAEETQLTNQLSEKFNASHLGVTNVSSSFSHQIAIGALWAIFGSLLLIVLYIWLRFDLKFAGPVIVALLHDILITVGIYSLTGREVTTSTVAAVLTVLGYSIYDTIIIFDRVRENVPLMKRDPFATIANVSLWETIRRSLATTFITLLPVISLLLFGGGTLKDFAFALLVGIASGAYSSIFIAAPLLTMWKEREPEFARRKAEAHRLSAQEAEQALRESELALAAEPAPHTPMDEIEELFEGPDATDDDELVAAGNGAAASGNGDAGLDEGDGDPDSDGDGEGGDGGAPVDGESSVAAKRAQRRRRRHGRPR